MGLEVAASAKKKNMDDKGTFEAVDVIVKLVWALKA